MTRADADAGFGLIELVVAITIVAAAFLGLTHATAGGLFALESARQRSVFIEGANAEMESLRAMPFESLGVSYADPDRAGAYPGGRHDGLAEVVLDPAALAASDPELPPPPRAVQTVEESTVEGVRTPYTVRRWITWSGDAGAGGATEVKRITIEVEWSESGRGRRHAVLHSLRYPGGKGRSPLNQAPVADAVATPATTTTGSPVQFTGVGSSDPDGSVATYAWQFGDSATGSGVTVTHAFASPGTYAVVLTTTDDQGATSSDTVSVSVAASDDDPPTASFSSSATTGTAPFTVNVDASASSDPEGTPLSYSWSWGDGTADGSGVSATHVYSSAGTYTTRLTVTDEAGLTAAATLDVTAVPLNCSITGGSFRNGTNPALNDIRVKNSSGMLVQNGFAFTATTNAGCTTLSVSIPNITGSLVPGALVDGIRTWTLSTSSSARFAVATAQSGTFTGSGAATFPFKLDVHR